MIQKGAHGTHAENIWTLSRTYHIHIERGATPRTYSSRLKKVGFSRGLPLPRISGGRTGGRAGTPFLGVFVLFVFCGGRFYRPWEVSHFCAGVKIILECTTNHLWRPPGLRDMTNFVKHVFFAKDVLGGNHCKKEDSKLYRVVFSKYKTVRLWSTL